MVAGRLVGFSPLPSRRSGLDRDFSALFRCHGNHPALAANPAALAAHSGHDAGYVGGRYSGRMGFAVSGSG